MYILTGMVLIGIMLFFAYPKEVSAAETQRTVKVGVFELPGFCEIQDGNLAGYNYEYICELAELTGWECEFVQVTDYEGGLERLDADVIDLLAPAQMTEEGLEKYLYSEFSAGKQYTALITNSGRADLNYEDYEAFQGLSVAVVKDSFYTENFLDYAKKHLLTVELVYCNTTTEATSKMRNKEVDATVVNLLEVQENDKVLARFGQAPFYFITTPGKEALMQELNEAMSKLQENRPNLPNDLSEVYFPIYNIQYINAEQREFIKKTSTLRVGYVQDNLPVSYKDPETGEFAGITRDILDAIQELSGLRFEYVALPIGNVDYEYLQENNIIITADVTYNRWNRRVGRMVVTMPYDFMNKVMVADENLIFYRNGSLRLAMSTGSQTIDKVIAEEYPNFIQQNYATTEDAFDAVLTGAADVLLVNQYAADYWLGRPIYSRLEVVHEEGTGDDHCLAVMDYSEGGESTDHKMIKNILDAAISQLSTDDVNMIVFQNTLSHRYQYTWKDFLYENRITLSLTIAIILLIVLMQAIMGVMRKKNYQTLAEEERKLAIQQKRYELIIEKSEDIIFETDLQTGEGTASGIMRDKFGWSLDDFRPSRDPDELMKCWKVHKDDAAALKEAYLKTRRQCENSECVVRLVKKEVGYVWCRVRRYPIMNEKGEVVKILGNIINIDQMTKEAQKLKSQTRTDSMTGLLNKNTFLAEVAEYLHEEDQINFCMVFFDLDYFKQVNDILGHLVGDTAIKEAAQKLQVHFANVDLVSRFGGDEFCIFVKNIPVETIRERLEFTREKLKATYEKANQSVKVTASIGAAYYHCTEKNVQKIVEEADKAVYQAKVEGRNRVVFKEIM